MNLARTGKCFADVVAAVEPVRAENGGGTLDKQLVECRGDFRRRRQCRPLQTDKEQCIHGNAIQNANRKNRKPIPRHSQKLTTKDKKKKKNKAELGLDAD